MRTIPSSIRQLAIANIGIHTAFLFIFFVHDKKTYHVQRFILLGCSLLFIIKKKETSAGPNSLTTTSKLSLLLYKRDRIK